MRLNWNEIRVRAAQFAKDWADASYEKGETQSFYNDFFEVFGVKRRRVAVYEQQVKKLNDKQGFIDLFWPSVLLIEQKSAGRDLTKARQQADEYCLGLKDNEFPRYILLSDFQTFELYDLEEGIEAKFSLADLPKNVEKLGFIIGVQKRSFQDQDPVNIEASELMGRVHDALEESGYVGHDLEQFLVRLLFCLFADDTGIFEPRGIFETLIKDRTSEDGSDLGQWVSHLFDVLNTPEEKRLKNLDEDLSAFPYINGDLFKDRLPIPAFDAEMRKVLIEACEFSWDAISPAIFGSLFQSVMNKDERRKAGAHYTNEKNIMKVIEPLFLDDLRKELEALKARKTKRDEMLRAFQKKLGSLTFFDPACGCGNFLIIAYRELRQLELETLIALRKDEQLTLDATAMSVVDVDQFFGIEIGEFAARIAEVAMWMIDHIMNNRLSLEFGLTFVRIPLKKSPHIVVGNALATSWESVLPAQQCSYLLGNPPFVGHQWRTKSQQEDMRRIWGNDGQVNRLDYVTCWFKKGLDYSDPARTTEIAFVSTNSITQGEQCGILWPPLFASGLSIRFAHRTFQWNSEARGKAAVHCVIVGLTYSKDPVRKIFEYEHVRGEPHETRVSQINGYLIDGPQYSLPARGKPPSGRSRILQGSKPADGARLKKPGGGYIKHSNLILEDSDRQKLLSEDPNARKWLRPYVGGQELISGDWRWCLWLKNADPKEISQSKPVLERLRRVRDGRLQSPTKSVREFAETPSLFTQDRQPDGPYLAIPEVSSERRFYIPIAMLTSDVIASNKLLTLQGATLYDFGILTSAMHMAWMRTVAGRLKSDYSYAPAIYNTFPWPEVSAAQSQGIESIAQEILDTRASFPSASLDVLYDPDTMPPALRKAHIKLDKAVDRLYRRKLFEFERERVEHLFGMYEQMSAPIEAAAKTRKRRKQ
ncbi:class I SAM-dependent DNA methyltransferase [Pseudooceanicola atlanticus]|uniref:class I SAM-dependent DNA methyltransferase n=1 Tax=Pseudooceanicola atlanticus TaxID=1461694 RepID=UPI002355269E|nr:DNA methyltransferase [Pseudooceanicola atlanticus]